MSENRIPSQFSEEERAGLHRAWEEGTGTVADLARTYDMLPDTLRVYFRRQGVERVAAPLEVSAEWTDEDYGLQVVHDRQVVQLKAQLKHINRLYQANMRSMSTQDMLVESMKDVVTAWPAPTLDILKVPTKVSTGTHTMVGMVSDLHVGEVVSSEHLMGLGDGYDLEIFRQRVGLWVRSFLRLLEIERSGREIPKLTLFLDGDFISGLIHDELLKTNAVNVLDQTTLTATVMAWAIREIGRHFEEVHISCTVGNHGRNQQKIEYKDTHVNWDYICYQMMAMLLKNDTHITWDIPKSLWAITRVENLNLFHYHGHGKIYNSLSIPYYGIERAIREFREIFQVIDLSFDGICMGHFHHFFERDLGTGPIIINPCWKGGDEFATLGLRKYSKPAQVMFMVHSKRGYIGSQMIHLWGQEESDAEGVPHGSASVWAETVL